MTMTCHNVRDSLLDYLAGDIAPEDRWDVERHLQACPRCLSDVDASRHSLRVSRAAVAAMRDPSSEDVPMDLLRAIVGLQNSRSTPADPAIEPSPVRVQFSEMPIRM